MALHLLSGRVQPSRLQTTGSGSWKSPQAFRHEHESEICLREEVLDASNRGLLGRRKFDQSAWRMANNQRFLSSLDHGKLWEKSKGLALPRLEQRGTPQWSLNDIPKQKKNESSNEKHTHRSRISPTMPRTSFPGHNCANGLFTHRVLSLQRNQSSTRRTNRRWNLPAKLWKSDCIASQRRCFHKCSGSKSRYSWNENATQVHVKKISPNTAATAHSKIHKCQGNLAKSTKLTGHWPQGAFEWSRWTGHPHYCRKGCSRIHTCHCSRPTCRSRRRDKPRGPLRRLQKKVRKELFSLKRTKDGPRLF